MKATSPSFLNQRRGGVTGRTKQRPPRRKPTAMMITNDNNNNKRSKKKYSPKKQQEQHQKQEQQQQYQQEQQRDQYSSIQIPKFFYIVVGFMLCVAMYFTTDTWVHNHKNSLSGGVFVDNNNNNNDDDGSSREVDFIQEEEEQEHGNLRMDPEVFGKDVDNIIIRNGVDGNKDYDDYDYKRNENQEIADSSKNKSMSVSTLNNDMSSELEPKLELEPISIKKEVRLDVPPLLRTTSTTSSTTTLSSNPKSTCLSSISEMSPTELHPQKGNRHMVQPPSDNNKHHHHHNSDQTTTATSTTSTTHIKENQITLVCCETTAGSLSIAVHSNWAPLGSARFLDMVQSNYFSSKVPFMRCIHNFLCQFGIAGDPSFNSRYKTSILDDPNWLPEGPDYRVDKLSGVKRYAKGYMAFAGGGKNTRSNQLIMALEDNKFLGGGSPWEVPWGEVVGVESFVTMGKIYTGYGEHGPSQGRLFHEGASEAIQRDFPNLDYVTSCHVVDQLSF